MNFTNGDVKNIGVELECIEAQIVGKTKALMTLRRIFREIRDPAGKSLQKAVVIATDYGSDSGFYKELIRMDTDGIKTRKLSKTIYG